MAVEHILKEADIQFTGVQLGQIDLQNTISESQKNGLGAQLSNIGFSLIDSRTSGIIEKLKLLIIDRARNKGDEKSSRLNLSAYLTMHVHHEYTYLSNLFSSIENRTIENYYIEQRIEYVKELLVYDEMSLSEIAMHLDYSSAAHLSGQFKKITGLTPSHYKKIGAIKRKGLDQV